MASNSNWSFPEDPQGGGGPPMSDSQRVQQQWAQMSDQDKTLDEISAGVGRLNEHARNMNDELDQHSRIIDQMDRDVDTANQGLVDETAHAMKIRKQAGLCRYYLCILLLFIILVLLLVFG